MTHSSKTLQDHLEKIYVLSNDNTGVRVVDIANSLKIKAPSVVEVITKLKKQKLVEQPKRGLITLTDAGLAEAKSVHQRHKILEKFFTTVLRLPTEIAEVDACEVEHAISKETFYRLCDFLDHLSADAIEQDNTIPLTLMVKNESGIIKRSSSIKLHVKRLVAMGIHKGQRIRVLQNLGRLPIKIEVENTTVAISRQLATELHISIDPKEASNG